MAKELTPAQQARRSLSKTYRKSIWNPFVQAMKNYQLVSPGDRVAVCISGGKDSMLLAVLMEMLQKNSEKPGVDDLIKQKTEQALTDDLMPQNASPHTYSDADNIILPGRPASKYTASGVS